MVLLYHKCDVYVSDMTDEPKGLAADDGFYFYEGDFFSEEDKEKKFVFSRWDNELKIERYIFISEPDLMIAIEKERRKKEQKNEENV